MSNQFNIQWHDGGREPQCKPDPTYPNGKDLRLLITPKCRVDLPYPAKRCGIYIIECRRCGQRVGCTTAGRLDDPKSIELPCLALLQ